MVETPFVSATYHIFVFFQLLRCVSIRPCTQFVPRFERSAPHSIRFTNVALTVVTLFTPIHTYRL